MKPEEQAELRKIADRIEEQANESEACYFPGLPTGTSAKSIARKRADVLFLRRLAGMP